MQRQISYGGRCRPFWVIVQQLDRSRGIAVKKTGKYLIPLYVGWVLTIIGAGLLTTLRADSNFVKAVGFQVVVGSGIGLFTL